MLSLLENLGPGDVIPEPFPHIAIRSPLKSWCDYSGLAKHFPQIALPRTINANTAYRLSAAKWISMSPLEKLEYGNWEITRKFNMGPGFIRDFVRVFGFWIEHYYGSDFCGLLLNSATKVGTRGCKDSKSADIHCDFQFVINTPATEHHTTVRDPHCDNPLELFAGLWYFADPNDVGNGGDLRLHFRRDETRDVAFHRSKWGKGSVSYDQLGTFIEYPYMSDMFVMFLNTPNSIHSVSHRHPGCPFRRYVNIIAEINKPLFLLG